MTDLATRFWAKVARKGSDDCWEWTASRTWQGYGIFRNPAGATAHRLAWTLENGPIPDGMCVCHRCDNPPCQNPAHLFIGTVADNNRDRHAKGRTVALGHQGEDHWKSKLTADDVLAIRVAFQQRHRSGKELAKMYGVTKPMISLIVNLKNWANVPKSLAHALRRAR